MLKIVVIIVISFILAGCTSKKEVNTDLFKKEIADADKSMSELATKEGFNAALGKYAADDFVKFTGGGHPIIGKKEFDEKTKNKPGPKTLTWKPVKADVASSGDLGYTWGNWKFVLPDTVLYGNYFTVWEKQSDGSWKMSLDGGNETPPPGN